MNGRRVGTVGMAWWKPELLVFGRVFNLSSASRVCFVLAPLQKQQQKIESSKETTGAWRRIFNNFAADNVKICSNLIRKKSLQHYVSSSEDWEQKKLIILWSFLLLLCRYGRRRCVYGLLGTQDNLRIFLSLFLWCRLLFLSLFSMSIWRDVSLECSALVLKPLCPRLSMTKHENRDEKHFSRLSSDDRHCTKEIY